MFYVQFIIFWSLEVFWLASKGLQVHVLGQPQPNIFFQCRDPQGRDGDPCSGIAEAEAKGSQHVVPSPSRDMKIRQHNPAQY